MPSLQEALRAAQLVTTTEAEAAEHQKRAQLTTEEEQRALHASTHSRRDEENLQRQERFMHGAARETTQASSRVGTRQYFDRFKKRDP
jgi:hypothetical protein